MFALSGTLPPPLDQRPALRRLAPALRLIEHILDEDGDLLARWRARLTAVFLIVTATLGLLPAVTTVVVSWRNGLLGLAALDAGLMLFVYWLLLSHRPSNELRNRFLACASFAIGVTALVELGPFSTALSWLMLATFLATFLLGLRAAVVAVIATTFVLVGVAQGIEYEWFGWVAEFPGSAQRWMLTSLDFLFLTVMFAGVNGLILRLLESEDKARVLAETRLAEGRRHEALGTLASGIAHDFNNLLVPVLANVESVQQTMTPGSPEQLALHDAHRSAQRARDLVQRILAFGRGVDAARGQLDACVVARDVVDLVRLALPSTVQLTLDCDASPSVHASVAELHQVLHNLVTNAVHAVAVRGDVHVHVRSVTHEGLPCTELRVTDTGVGMDEETRERVFDPYFSTRGPERGTGLGLPIVRSIVTSLGGDVSVESRLGQGSTFTVRLPAVAPSPTLPTAARAPARADGPLVVPSGTRVLLVDDEHSVRRATARLLQSLGCEVIQAASANEAIASVSSSVDGFDVMLTDHRMPGRSGLELIGALQEQRVLVATVLMSGHLEAAAHAGTVPERVVLLQKPFSRAELAASLLGALTVHASL